MNTITIKHESTVEMTPQELGKLFANMDDGQQAAFFAAAAEFDFMQDQSWHIGRRICELGRDSKAWEFVANLCSTVMVHTWRHSSKDWRDLP